MISAAYTYDAVVRSIYDGDTVRLDVDLGFETWATNVQIRLYGIDTPEVRGVERPSGLITRDWLRDTIPVMSKIVFTSHKSSKGKYGRWLGELYKGNLNLNREMVRLGLAKDYMYDHPG